MQHLGGRGMETSPRFWTPNEYYQPTEQGANLFHLRRHRFAMTGQPTIAKPQSEGRQAAFLANTISSKDGSGLIRGLSFSAA